MVDLGRCCRSLLCHSAVLGEKMLSKSQSGLREQETRNVKVDIYQPTHALELPSRPQVSQAAASDIISVIARALH